MAYLWDSNILRYYTAKHPALLDHLKRVPSHEVLIPIIVYAEQVGRIIFPGLYCDCGNSGRCS